MRDALSEIIFDLAIVDQHPGLVVLRITGKQADRVFENESGGHRWQRIPPTEKRGRVHTSTITVAVLMEPSDTDMHIPDAEIEIIAARGSGPGGQHRNKTESAITARHRPTGLIAHAESERSKHQNQALAIAVLKSRIWAQRRGEETRAVASNRKQQVGTGMRGDKRRTIRTRDGIVTDHILGTRWQLERYLQGDW